MLKYLRMDAYRLVKGKMLYVTLGIILAMSMFSVIMMRVTAMPELGSTVSFSVGLTDGSAPGSMAGQNGMELAELTQLHANMWVSGGAMASIVCLVIALFFALDFSSGYVKNLPSSRRDRLAYYGGKILLIVMLSALFLAFGMVSFELFRAMTGFTYARATSVAEIAVWFGSALVVVSMYGALTSLVTWLTQNKVAGIVAALVVGSGVVGAVLVMALTSLSVAWEPLARVAEWLPYSSYALLAQGGEALLASPGDVGHIIVTCGTVLVACIAAALGVCSRKDV